MFAPLPRLCYRERGAQGELQLLEREAVTEEMDLILLAEPVSLPGLTMAEQGTLWEVYLDGQRLRVGRGDAAQLPLDTASPTITDDDLTRWLCAELQQPARNAARDVTPGHLRAFVLATVRHLIHEKHLPLEQMARHQYPIAQQLGVRELLRDVHPLLQAIEHGENAAAVRMCGPDPAHFRFFEVLRHRPDLFALVLDDQMPSIGQLADEVRIEASERRGQPESGDRIGIEIADPMLHQRVFVDRQGATPFFAAVFQVRRHGVEVPGEPELAVIAPVLR